MKSIISLCCVIVSASAFAEGAAPMDVTKVGPGVRKPADEKKTKAEIAAFFKKSEELEKAGNMEAMLATHDFPMFMVTDDAKGAVEARLVSKDDYVAMMKPMMEAMPKDLKMTHKQTITVLSDSLVSVSDDFTETTGKTKVTGKNHSLLAKVGGEWKWKSMTEAGWGGMSAPAAAPAAPAAAAPAPAAAPAKK